jgi:hypothetical protein
MKSCIYYTLYGIAFLIASPVQADTCAPVVARVVELTNASFVETSTDGNNTTLKHRNAQSFVVTCSPVSSPIVSLHWIGAYPPYEFFILTAKAGEAVTSRRSSSISPILRDCHTKALKAIGVELAEVHRRGIGVECQAFTRDGGATAFSIFLEEK